MRPSERVAIAVVKCMRAYLRKSGAKDGDILILTPEMKFVEDFMASIIELEREDARMDEHNNKGRAAAARDRAVEIQNNIIALRKINIEKLAAAGD
jgi:hypothetical protein